MSVIFLGITLLNQPYISASILYKRQSLSFCIVKLHCNNHVLSNQCHVMHAITTDANTLIGLMLTDCQLWNFESKFGYNLYDRLEFSSVFKIIAVLCHLLLQRKDLQVDGVTTHSPSKCHWHAQSKCSKQSLVMIEELQYAL